VHERVRNIIGIDDEAFETIRLDILMQELGITEEQDVKQWLSQFSLHSRSVSRVGGSSIWGFIDQTLA
jgi:hypothetical protein